MAPNNYDYEPTPKEAEGLRGCDPETNVVRRDVIHKRPQSLPALHSYTKVEDVLDSHFIWRINNLEWEARQLVIKMRGKDIYDRLDPIVQERYRKIALKHIRDEQRTNSTT